MANNELDAEGALKRFLANLSETPSEGVKVNDDSVIQNMNREEKRMEELDIKDKEVDIDLKGRYGNTILNILIGWLVFVGLILLSQLGPVSCKLSDEVLITLITTSTANIIALPVIILRYLCPKK